MVYLQIKVFKGVTYHTLNICNPTKSVDEKGNTIFKSATEYVTPLEYKVLQQSGLFTEKEKYIKE